MKNEKILTKLSSKELKAISGGEVQQYRSICYLWMKRFRVTNDMSGTVAIDGIKDFNEALKLNNELNAHIDKHQNIDKKIILK